MRPQPQHLIRRWSPEEEVVLLSARTDSDPDTRERLRETAEKVTNWELVVQHGFMHGLLPLIHHRLQEAGSREKIPAASAKAFHDAHLLSVMQTLNLTSALGEILELLGDRSIQAVPTKGPVLGELLYSDFCLRPFVDLDVIVPREHVDAAIQALEEAGGFRGPPVLSESARRHRREAEYSAHLMHEDKRIPLDLHWDFSRQHFSTRLPTEWIWGRTRTIQIGDRSTVVMDPAIMLLTLAIHGSKHGPFPWPKLKWAVDVDGFLRSAGLVDWEELIALSAEVGCRRMLLLGFALASTLLESPLPGVVARSLESDPRVWGLAEPTTSRLFALGDRSMPLGERMQLDLRLRERTMDRARYMVNRLIQPSERDLEADRIPPRWPFLHLPMRLARLTRTYVAHPSRLRRLLVGGNREETARE